MLFYTLQKKGNLTRFINHSCDPNAETQKWTVNGKCRIGIFSRKPIKAFEEITINYQFVRFGWVVLFYQLIEKSWYFYCSIFVVQSHCSKYFNHPIVFALINVFFPSSFFVLQQRRSKMLLRITELRWLDWVLICHLYIKRKCWPALPMQYYKTNLLLFSKQSHKIYIYFSHAIYFVAHKIVHHFHIIDKN